MHRAEKEGWNGERQRKEEEDEEKGRVYM